MSDAPPATVATPATPPSEGCPTPLAWRDVLATFRAERREHRWETGWGDAVVWEFGEGPPLWILGAAAGDGELFALTAWLLREHRQCRIVHLPAPPTSIAPSALVAIWGEMFATIVQQDSLPGQTCRDCPVFATGTGGLIALQAAISSPQELSHLILHGVGLHKPWRLTERWLLKMSRHMPGTLHRVPGWNRITAANHRSWFPPFDGDRWDFLRDNLARTPIRQWGTRMSMWLGDEVQNRLAEIVCPVMLVRTEGEGTALTEAQESLAQRLADSRVEWMHSTGYFPFLTHPHRLVKLIRDFLTPPSESSSRPPLS